MGSREALAELIHRAVAVFGVAWLLEVVEDELRAAGAVILANARRGDG